MVVKVEVNVVLKRGTDAVDSDVGVGLLLLLLLHLSRGS
jgi:hypothetical protein